MAELKNLKKGDTVIIHLFTGVAAGRKTVLEADAKTVTLETRIGRAKFSKKTGIQTEPAPKAPRFASYITEDDGSFVAPQTQRKLERKEKEKAAKAAEKVKAKKAKKPEIEPEDPEDEDIEEIPAPAKIVSKKTSKKPKKSEPAPEPEDAEDEDEDIDEDDYEEVE